MTTERLAGKDGGFLWSDRFDVCKDSVVWLRFDRCGVLSSVCLRLEPSVGAVAWSLRLELSLGAFDWILRPGSSMLLGGGASDEGVIRGRRAVVVTLFVG